MGGQSLKFRKKQAREVAAQVEIGQAKGKLKAMKSLGLDDQLRLFISKVLDKLTFQEMMEAAIVISGTIVVHGVIVGTQDLLGSIQAKVKDNPLFYFSIFNDPYGWLGGKTPADIIRQIPDWQIWMLSFLVSGLIYKFGDTIIQSFGGIGGLVKTIVGIA